MKCLGNTLCFFLPAISQCFAENVFLWGGHPARPLAVATHVASPTRRCICLHWDALVELYLSQNLRKFPFEMPFVGANGRSPLQYVVSMRKSCVC